MRVGNIEIKNGAWLAPMAGVTDVVFREICTEMGAAMTCTEMVSAKGLYYNPDRRGSLRAAADNSPIRSMQMFGAEPELLASMAREYGQEFSVIDINMGCPAPKIVKSGQGCALMNDPALAEAIVRAVSRAVPQPVTVKIRKGWDSEHENYLDFARRMEDAGAAALTIHGRTREQFYAPSADWEAIARVKEALSIPVIGNGDVFTGADALRMKRETGCDAVMVARGAQGNPWLFREILCAEESLPYTPPTPQEKMRMAMRHAEGLCELREERFAIPAMRKHAAWYLKGIPGAAVLRTRIMACDTLAGLRDILKDAGLL